MWILTSECSKSSYAFVIFKPYLLWNDFLLLISELLKSEWWKSIISNLLTRVSDNPSSGVYVNFIFIGDWSKLSDYSRGFSFYYYIAVSKFGNSIFKAFMAIDAFKPFFHLFYITSLDFLLTILSSCTF